jgi:glycosyltransferase involved in cell wall biosynthesis
MSKNITATIITLNEEENIKDCINSVKKVCDEVIVVDSKSTDKTVEIAKSLGVKVIIQEYLGDGLQKDFGVGFAKNDWILSIDADERLDDDMLQDILSLDLKNSSFDAYAFRRKNYIGDRLQKIWYPDYVTRLYDKNRCRYLPIRGHSKVDSKNLKKLNSHIIHYTYKDLSDMARKIDKFSARSALMMYEKGKKVSVCAPIIHGCAAFLKKYILKKGFLYGLDGLSVSLFSGFNSYLKYAMLIEMRQNDKQG